MKISVLLPLSILAAVLTSCVTTQHSVKPLPERERIVRLQIFLDENNFGPGKIDGQWGLYTEQSRLRYLAAHGKKFDEHWERTMGVGVVDPVYTKHTVTASDLKSVGHLPSAKEEQVKLKAMPYRSLAEMLAERYHSTEGFLATLNPGTSINSLQAGAQVTVPNVTPFKIEKIPHKGKIPANPSHANRRIKIDTSDRYLEVFDGDRIVAAFPITPGSSSLPAPKGDWKIVGIATMPWFRWDDGVLKRGERTDEFFLLPSGPNNPVGVLWVGLSKPGIGIHGTNNPFTIGRAGSHGCIRMSNWNASRMPGLVSKGTPVRID